MWSFKHKHRSRYHNIRLTLATNSVGRPHVGHSLSLAGSETSVARIVRVIHVVVDRINTGDRGAAVLGRLRRTSISAGALHGCVADEVAVASAGVALESVQETHPVAGLVDGGHAQVEAVDVAAGHGVGLDHAAVAAVRAGSGCAGTNVGGKTARAEDAAGEVGHEVNVQSAVCAIAEGVLHSSGIGSLSDSPGVVDGEGGGNAVELHEAGCVSLVHDGELIVSHLLSDGAGLCAGGDDVHGEVDDDGVLCVSADSEAGDLCATVGLEDALVHQAHSLVEVLAGAADVNTAVKVLVNSAICGFGTSRDQEAGETDQDAGKVHVVVLFSWKRRAGG